MNSFQNHRIMWLEYEEFDIVGKKSSVKKPSELGSEKWSCYERDTHHLNLIVDLNILLILFGDLWHFFCINSRVRKIH